MNYITSVSDFISNLSKKNSLEFKPIYRGQSNIEDKLLPSLFRKEIYQQVFPIEGANKFKYYEDLVIKLFIKNGYPLIDSYFKDNLLLLTILSQHHGLPTRLLDWTENPLVSLFFATSNDANSDSVVYELELDSILEIRNQSVNNIEPNRLSVLYPPHISDRVSKQSGCFTIFKLPEDDKKILDLEEQIKLDGSNYKLNRFIIKNEDRARILEELNRLGINNYSIFPDLDGLSKKNLWEIKNTELINDNGFSSYSYDFLNE